MQREIGLAHNVFVVPLTTSSHFQAMVKFLRLMLCLAFLTNSAT